MCSFLDRLTWASHARNGSKKPGRSKALPEPSSSFTFHLPSPYCCAKVPHTPFFARRPVRRTLVPFCRGTLPPLDGGLDTRLGHPPSGAFARAGWAGALTKAKLSGTGRRSTLAKSCRALRSSSRCFSQCAWAATSVVCSSSLIWPALGDRYISRLNLSKWDAENHSGGLIVQHAAHSTLHESGMVSNSSGVAFRMSSEAKALKRIPMPPTAPHMRPTASTSGLCIPGILSR
mmetsp:Transcript_67460/g.160939  ORF Transcript_67460/g.160939 Transcript_67460/m.160939 type:complete len:232 (-) Transcript_67460:1612-2307(-)